MDGEYTAENLRLQQKIILIRHSNGIAGELQDIHDTSLKKRS